jgi:hypothetical protein
VGHEPQSLPDVRGTDAVCSKYRRPAGVTFSFQVSLNKVEPTVTDGCRNLLTNNDWRAALADETEPLRPEMPGVVGSGLLACGAEGLARAGAGENSGIIRPSSTTKGPGPGTEAGEEVALQVGSKVVGSYIGNTPGIHVARRNQAGFDEVPQPFGSEGIDLVVVGGHRFRKLRARSRAAKKSPTVAAGGCSK